MWAENYLTKMLPASEHVTVWLSREWAEQVDGKKIQKFPVRIATKCLYKTHLYILIRHLYLFLHIFLFHNFNKWKLLFSTIKIA